MSLKELGEDLSGEKIRVFTEHFERTNADTKHRFQDLYNLVVPSWILNPFEADTDLTGFSVEDELLELKNDFELKPLYKEGKLSEILNASCNSKQISQTVGRDEIVFHCPPYIVLG